MCQLGWRLLIVHGRNPRLHVCFDKVNNGPMYNIISSPRSIFTIYKWPHTPQTEGEVGYILKVATKTLINTNKIAVAP